MSVYNQSINSFWDPYLQYSEAALNMAKPKAPEPPKEDTIHTILNRMPGIPVSFEEVQEAISKSHDHFKGLIVPHNIASITNEQITLAVFYGYLGANHGISTEHIQTLVNTMGTIKASLIGSMQVSQRGANIARKLGLL